MVKKEIDSLIINRLKLLKLEFESTFEMTLESRKSYVAAAIKIEENGGRKISEDTLIDIWQQELEHYPYTDTLNTIVQAINYRDWDSFCDITDRNTTLYSFFDPAKYNVESLQVGEEITLGWFPQYYVSFEYLGEYEFKILSCSKTFKRQAGNIITAHGFGLRYTYNIPEDTFDDKGNIIETMGYPLYPSITFRVAPMPEDYPEIESHRFNILY